eukprot:5110562-Amphidinium_carterae.1
MPDATHDEYQLLASSPHPHSSAGARNGEPTSTPDSRVSAPSTQPYTPDGTQVPPPAPTPPDAPRLALSQSPAATVINAVRSWTQRGTCSSARFQTEAKRAIAAGPPGIPHSATAAVEPAIADPFRDAPPPAFPPLNGQGPEVLLHPPAAI